MVETYGWTLPKPKKRFPGKKAEITKTFQGKKYTYEKTFKTKKKAQNYAKLRRRVRNTRVVKGPNTVGTSWDIFTIKRN